MNEEQQFGFNIQTQKKAFNTLDQITSDPPAAISTRFEFRKDDIALPSVS
jgi:hypothetical protein